MSGKYKRKQLVVDKKFQGRTAISITLIFTMLMGLVIGLMSYNIVVNNKRMANIHRIENAIITFVLGTIPNSDKGGYAKAIEKSMSNHKRNMEQIQQIAKRNNILIFIIFILAIAEGVVLYFMLLYKTHKIAGPVHVMTSYMKEIIDGKMPHFRKLRDKDELQDFYAVFQKMVFVLQKDQPGLTENNGAPKDKAAEG